MLPESLLNIMSARPSGSAVGISPSNYEQVENFPKYFDKEDLYDSEQQDYNTLAGLIIEQLKHIPQAGERTEWNCFNFEIVDMDGARIDKVLVTLNGKQEEENN